MLIRLIEALGKNGFEVALYAPVAGSALANISPSIRVFTHPLGRSKRHLSQRIAASSPRLWKFLFWLHVKSVHNAFRPDLWHLNTVHMADIAAFAGRLGVPYVAHFHDLLMMYGLVSAASLSRMVKGASVAIGCSEVVCEALRTMGAPRVELLYESIEVETVQTTSRRSSIREQLGIPENAFVWMMSGTISYRKGTDLFVRVARVPSTRRAYFFRE